MAIPLVRKILTDGQIQQYIDHYNGVWLLISAIEFVT